MKHVSILALQDATLTSIDGTYQLLSRVNDFLRYKGKKAFYRIEIVGVNATLNLNDGLYQISVQRLARELRKTDLIIVPIICADFSKAIRANKEMADWVIHQYGRGAEIASLCVGAFFLASTGLLNERECSTHWAAADEFRKMFPRVRLQDEKIITSDNGIYTSGGNYSYLNLLLYLIEKDLGKEIAVLAAKMFEIEIGRQSQSEFLIFQGQKQHGDRTIAAIQHFIEEHFIEELSVLALSEKFAIGRRTLERRFKLLTGNSVFEYIQRVRVEAAKQVLDKGMKTVSEVVYEVGYVDKDAFRNIFKKYVGLSPVEYAHKFGGRMR